ncbi:hypothetical protein [Paraburkholderia sprentiae]|uniref:hypothetical protein n=1 Tax=Paraburkholderia sprentiae TaxID=948107 RepID=UPI001E461F2D|nr:hypothetical protein [Paraburkholderia sprentiae]
MNQFTDIDHKNLDPVRQQFAWEALAAHFDDRSPEELTSSQRQFPHHTRPELQQTLSRLLTPFAPRLLGLNQVHERFPLTISSLFVQSTGPMSTTVSLAPVKYRDVDVGEETPVAVLDNGLWLITDGELRAAVLFEQHMEGMNTSIASVEIVSLPNARGLAFGSEVYAGAGAGNSRVPSVPGQGSFPRGNRGLFRPAPQHRRAPSACRGASGRHPVTANHGAAGSQYF